MLIDSRCHRPPVSAGVFVAVVQVHGEDPAVTRERPGIAWGMLSARVAMLPAYALLAMVLIAVFAGAGHGSFAPLSLFSWGYLLAVRASWLFENDGPVSDIQMYTMVGVGLLYLVTIAVLNSITARGSRRALVLAPLVVHYLGVVVAMAVIEHGHLASPGMIAASIALALPLAIAYPSLDFWMARRSARRRSQRGKAHPSTTPRSERDVPDPREACKRESEPEE